ncbi:hemerythrin domain-containing protein [Actinoplanes regularis]|uniref:Hemerythrin HHE cation binding domain-containing protein n=1 Tax=Actinoplanes regularis TaxID=52697 RepID=A0A238XVK1_9ACTN|nr:hemerythrin domain-containing protein [Actinoplanes regularis]GIE87762.1 hemerythrin [Actinoplanes regularis]SNR62762.1 Hemerythrin HHE cation binding domain-containing protein [Actinoplanes regularis]
MSDLNLPPLPPIGDTISGRSVVDVLNEQHREITRLAEQVTAEEPERVRSALIATLSRHLSAEHQYLYPAVRTAVPDGDRIVDRGLAEDHELLELMRSTDRTPELVAAVRRHVRAATGELLPMLEQMAPVEDLIRLGNRVETAEEAAPTRPHPATPATPPWNKIVDPIVGVVDKVRDVATARTTYARDI